MDFLSSKPGDAATELDAGIFADGPDSRGFVKFNLDGEGGGMNCWYTFPGVGRTESQRPKVFACVERKCTWRGGRALDVEQGLEVKMWMDNMPGPLLARLIIFAPQQYYSREHPRF